jgi:hypothetical protein
MTTTHRGRHPAQEAATRPLRQPRAGACSRAHRAAAGHGCSARRPGLPGRSAGQARPPAVTLPGPGPPPTPLTNATSAASPASGLLGRPSSRPTTRQPTETSARSCGDGCPPPRPGPHRRRRRWDELDASGRTEANSRRLDAGRVDTGRVDTGPPDTRRAGHWMHWTPDGWTPDRRTPDGLDTGCTGHRTAGHRTAGPPDPHDGTAEWTPHDGRGPATDAVAGVLALPTTAATPDRWMAAGRSAGQPPSGRPSNQDSSAAGLPGRARPPPRPSAAGATPPSSWRLGALLSSDDYGSRVRPEAHGQVLWRASTQAAEANVMECGTVGGMARRREAEFWFRACRRRFEDDRRSW